MNGTVEFVVRAVVIGAGATVMMDLWAALLRYLGVPSLDFALLGRWLGHLPRGRWIHTSIASAPPVRGERWLGWTGHYAIGITLSMGLLWGLGVDWARAPTLPPALAFGLVTVVAPLFILQPGMGAGIASSKTARPVFNAGKSVVTHLVFGIGLYAAACVTSLR